MQARQKELYRKLFLSLRLSDRVPKDNLYRRLRERGRQIKKLRQSTVGPVFGSPTQFYGLRKIGVLGKAGAHKVMLMPAIAFNLKKYLKKGGKGPSMGMLGTIVDVLLVNLTDFYHQTQPKPVLLKTL